MVLVHLLATGLWPGTVAERPGTPVNGMIRYNSDNNKMEAYENGGWADLIGGGTGDFLRDGSLAMTGRFEAISGTAATPGIAVEFRSRAAICKNRSKIRMNGVEHLCA